MTVASVIPHGDGCTCTRCLGFSEGNRLSVRHGMYARLTVAEEAGVVELAEAFAALSPLEEERLQPLAHLAAAQLWRIRRAYSDLSENGVVRGPEGTPAPILRRLESAERAFMRSLEALAIVPSAAADLGLAVARRQALAAGQLDYSRLDADELERLAELVEKASAS
jgi:hypothetical protein